MTVLFVHSHRFSTIDGQVYSPGGLPKSVWIRYLNHFEKLVVLGRRLNEINKDKLTLSSHDNVSFELLDYLESPLAIYKHKARLKEDIKKVIKKHNIQAVIARLPSPIGYKVIDVCEELGIPFAVEVVACDFDSIYNYKFNTWYHPANLGVKLLAPFAKRKQKRYIAKAKHAIYVTEHYLQKIYPASKAIYTSHASNVELPDFEEKVLNQHVAYLNRETKTLKFGMIGNLDVHYKGYDIVLKALAIAKNEIPNFEVHFVGAGEGKSIKKLSKGLNLENHLVFNGKLSSGEAVFHYLDTLDVYFHPSRTEGLPRALIEAMGRACPSLASRAGGIPELLTPDTLHEIGNYKTLAAQIIKLVNDKDLMIEQAKANFQKAKEYTIPVLSNRRDEFWGRFREEVDKYYAK